MNIEITFYNYLTFMVYIIIQSVVLLEQGWGQQPFSSVGPK
jgi:hypothetical protein